MVFLVGKESPFFDREEACRGFEKNKENLDDVNGFERLVNDSRFFNVYDKDGYVGSVLDGLIRKYADDLPDKSFKNMLGDIKIKADTPAQLMEYFKKYGEN